MELSCVGTIPERSVVSNNEEIAAKYFFLVQNKPIQACIKRIMDILLSSAALIVVSPLWLLLVILIRIESKGAALFKQERVGYKEKTFYMYKFRSMVIDAEKQFEKVRELNDTNSVMFKAKDDPRITKIGKFIRRFSIDEIPQLLNVLKGEMSLVGPRPPLLRELKNYKQWHYVRFSKAPGLTGLWQVSGRATIKDFDEVVGLDYKYIRSWDLFQDIKIIFRTIPVVISGVGAG